MQKAQDYSFNKAHAACYALISYRTAWLRAHHPCEYMAALISSVMNTKDRVPFYVNACHELGDRGAAARRQRVADRLRRRRRQDPLRAERGQGRRRARLPHDHPRPRRGRPLRVALGLHRARRLLGRQQARARVARQVRRAARARAWACCRCSSRRSPTARSSRPTGSPGRGRSSTPSSTRRRSPGFKRHPPVPDERVREDRPAPAREGDARPLRLRAPALGAARRAARQDRRDDRRARAAA